MTGGRPQFFGEPKPFQEIVELTSSLDIIPLKSEDRSLALEELIVYANSSLQACSQLRSLTAAKHAAFSLQSNDHGILERALALA